MTVVTESDPEESVRPKPLDGSAEEVLLKTARPERLFYVSVSVICSAVTFALSATHPAPIFQAIQGGIAGAAIALGAANFRECLRIRRRLEALIAISRGNGV